MAGLSYRAQDQDSGVHYFVKAQILQTQGCFALSTTEVYYLSQYSCGDKAKRCCLAYYCNIFLQLYYFMYVLFPHFVFKTLEIFNILQ